MLIKLLKQILFEFVSCFYKFLKWPNQSNILSNNLFYICLILISVTTTQDSKLLTYVYPLCPHVIKVSLKISIFLLTHIFQNMLLSLLEFPHNLFQRMIFYFAFFVT